MFKGEFDCEVEVVHEILHELELFGSVYKDQENIACESLPEWDCPDEDFPDGFFVVSLEEDGIWWGGFGSHGCDDKLQKMPTYEWTAVVLQDGFK